MATCNWPDCGHVENNPVDYVHKVDKNKHPRYFCEKHFDIARWLSN